MGTAWEGRGTPGPPCSFAGGRGRPSVALIGSTQWGVTVASPRPPPTPIDWQGQTTTPPLPAWQRPPPPLGLGSRAAEGAPAGAPQGGRGASELQVHGGAVSSVRVRDSPPPSLPSGRT